MRRPGRQDTASALGRLSRAPGLLRLGGDRELRLELQEAFLADPLDVHQLFDLLERSFLLAVIDDAGGGLGADARKDFEFSDRRGVQVDDGRWPRVFALSERLSAEKRGDGNDRAQQSKHGSSF